MSTAGSDPYKAFISYSSRDRAWADAACAALERAGHRCWIAPRDITAGTEWGAAIIDGIDRCRVMVLVFSSHADASTQVRREVERAVAKGLSILPLRIEDVRPRGAMEYALSSTHWLDAFAPPPEARLRQLAESVSALLAIPSPPSTAPADAPAVRPAAVPRPRRLARLAALLGLIVIAACVALAVWGRPESPPPPPTDPAPRPTRIVLNGQWTGSTETVFTMNAVLVADGTRLTGQIRWRLIGVPPDRPDLIDKENAVGVEEIVGAINDTELILAGTSISDPTWMGTGVYRVRLNKNDGTFQVSNPKGDAVEGTGSGTFAIVE